MRTVVERVSRNYFVVVYIVHNLWWIAAVHSNQFLWKSGVNTIFGRKIEIESNKRLIAAIESGLPIEIKIESELERVCEWYVKSQSGECECPRSSNPQKESKNRTERVKIDLNAENLAHRTKYYFIGHLFTSGEPASSQFRWIDINSHFLQSHSIRFAQNCLNSTHTIFIDREKCHTHSSEFQNIQMAINRQRNRVRVSESFFFSFFYFHNTIFSEEWKSCWFSWVVDGVCISNKVGERVGRYIVVLSCVCVAFWCIN